MPYCIKAEILSKEEIAIHVFRFVVAAEKIGQEAKAGQFVHLGVEGHPLRRPISLAAIQPDTGRLALVIQIRGEGTRLLCAKEPGDTFDLLGPLGHGFDLLPLDARAVMVGGGIGVPPLLPLVLHYRSNAAVILGFRTQSAAILTRDFEAPGCEVVLCTDDGTLGEKALVTEPLSRLLAAQRPDILYACGPVSMLQGVATLAKEKGIRCQLSMEQRMGCGVGACLTCACQTQNAVGERAYRHVCQYGPVFEAQEVVFP